MSQLQTPELMRQQNRAIVLATIQEHGPISRVELAHQLGLNPATITRITRVLLNEGLIQEEGESKSRGAGRKRVLLSFNHRARLVIGIFVNTHRITGAVADLAGTILTRCTKLLTSPISTAALFPLVEDLLNENPSYHSRLVSICMGAVTPEWLTPSLYEGLGGKPDIPILNLEAAALAAHSEAQVGAAQEQSRHLLFYLGSRSYSCLYVEGKTCVGEFGVSLEGQSLACRLCDEGLIDEMQTTLDSGISSVLQNQQHDLSARMIFEAARQGDKAARQAVESLAGTLAYAAVWITRSLGLTLIVIAGPWVWAADVFIPMVQAQMRHWCAEPPDLVPAERGDDAPLIGAIRLAVQMAETTVNGIGEGWWQTG